jgi:hypothetical protein
MMDVAKIKEHMDVLDSVGKKIGQVDHMEGSDKIKLTKTGSPDGKHHLVPLSWVDHIDSHVHLNKPVNDISALQKESYVACRDGSADAGIARKSPPVRRAFKVLHNSRSSLPTLGSAFRAVRAQASRSNPVFKTSRIASSLMRLAMTKGTHRPEVRPPKLLRIQLMTKRGSGLGVV